MKDENKEKKEYSTMEAAKILGVSFQTIIYWADRNYIRCRRTLGGHRKIPKSEILRIKDMTSYLDGGEQYDKKKRNAIAKCDELIRQNEKENSD